MKNIPFIALLTLGLTGGAAMAVEEPVYTNVIEEGVFSVRDYPALIAAEVNVSGGRSEAVNAGFRLLAGYIFGGNTRKQSVAMTAPVVQTATTGESVPMTAPVLQSGDASMWTVRFIMPSAYTLATLPTPNDPVVHLVPLAPARAAVVRFSGLAHESDIAEKTAGLRGFMTAHQLREAGPPSLARYNPPWTLWFMRRNEIIIPIARDTAP